MSEQKKYPGVNKKELRGFSQTQIGDLRDVGLEVVFIGMGATPDPKDKFQWRSADRNRITVGTRKNKPNDWFDHDAQKGGHGAIDLAMHLGNMDFKQAMVWLGAEAPKVDMVNAAVLHSYRTAIKAAKTAETAAPPEPVEKNWPRVKAYLVGKRNINESLVDDLHVRGAIYADRFANAVFLSKNGLSAELRGTQDKPYHGLRGETKFAFAIPPDKNDPEAAKMVAFTESAIEALSFRSLGFKGMIMSWGGQARENFAKAGEYFSERGYSIVAAFNNDSSGQRMAANLQEDLRGKNVEILKMLPKSKDFNQDLQNKSQASKADDTKSAAAYLKSTGRGG